MAALAGSVANSGATGSQDSLHPPSPVERVWKTDLYRLQQESPSPQAVLCSAASHCALGRLYGSEFHGVISHAEVARILTEDGMYLVRTSASKAGSATSNTQAILTLRFGGNIKHYHVFESDGLFYVKDTKRFASVRELVADGLVTMYIEREAGQYLEKMYASASYEKSPYMTLNRMKRKSAGHQEACKTPERTSVDGPPPAALGVNNNTYNMISKSSVPEIMCGKKRAAYDKAHAFKVHTFKGLNWCEFCGNFLWGFTAQGVKCDDCGFSAHGKCSEKVPADCAPSLKQLRGVFGIDLTTLAKAHRASRPFVLERCVEEIERRGLAESEGLYRVPGFSDHVENLKMAFDKDGAATRLGLDVYDNVNVIAGTLKLFLRLLPIPVVSFEAHPLLCKAADVRSLPEKIASIREALRVLPVAHYHTLEYLVRHLAKVSAQAERNKMPAYNLATVFAPTLMPAPDPPTLTSRGDIPGMEAQISVLETMITHHQLIFH